LVFGFVSFLNTFLNALIEQKMQMHIIFMEFLCCYYLNCTHLVAINFPLCPAAVTRAVTERRPGIWVLS